MERNENGAYLLDPVAVAEWLSGGVEEGLAPRRPTLRSRRSPTGSSRRRPPKTWCSSEGGRRSGPTSSTIRQDLQDAIPEPDRYEIEGYEVLEKTARATGTTARVTRAAQLGWRSG